MTPFDMQRMLLHEFPLMFVAEVALRALLAFVAVFVFLRSAAVAAFASFRCSSW